MGHPSVTPPRNENMAPSPNGHAKDFWDALPTSEPTAGLFRGERQRLVFALHNGLSPWDAAKATGLPYQRVREWLMQITEKDAEAEELHRLLLICEEPGPRVPTPLSVRYVRRAA